LGDTIGARRMTRIAGLSGRLFSRATPFAILVGLLVPLSFPAQALVANPAATNKAQLLELIENGRADAARQQLEAALAADPGNLGIANSLAALLTGLGKSEDGRRVLENALLANPESAAAFKNLRELAAQQFAESYAKALGQKAQSKQPVIEASPISIDEVKKAQSIAIARAEAKAKAEAQAKAKAEALARAEARSKPDASKSKATEAEPAVAAKPDTIPTSLQAWAQSWAEQDFERYASFYAESFSSEGYSSREAWLAFRKPRILNKGKIVIRISGVAVRAIEGGRQEVKFSQRYESGSLKVNSRKTQIWVLENKSWRIQSEKN